MTPESNISYRVENLPKLVDISSGFTFSLIPKEIPTLGWLQMYEPEDWLSDAWLLAGSECFSVTKEGNHGQYVYHIHPSSRRTVGHIYLKNEAGYRLDLTDFGPEIEIYKRKVWRKDGFAGNLWLIDKGEIKLVEEDSSSQPFLRTDLRVVLLPVIFKVPQGIIVTTNEEITRPEVLNFLKRFFNELERLPDERRPRFEIPQPEW